MAIQVVILAAGLGTRLGKPHPKPLTPLTSGESIMRRAVNSLRAAYGDEVFVTAVVGFKLDLVIEAMPDISFVYNEVYDSTNTSKSLLKALQLSQPGGVLWLNGDVVFDRRVLQLIHDKIDAGRSFVCGYGDALSYIRSEREELEADYQSARTKGDTSTLRHARDEFDEVITRLENGERVPFLRLLPRSCRTCSPVARAPLPRCVTRRGSPGCTAAFTIAATSKLGRRMACVSPATR